MDLKRLIWDSSSKRIPHDLVFNDKTPMDNEAEVTFGTAKGYFKRQIYNLRASFPLKIILLSLADIKACFRFSRIHTDLTGAFGFLISNIFCLAVAMVFGLNGVSPCCEPFRRAIEDLAVKFASCPDLVIKHKKYIGMIKWELPSSNQPTPTREMSLKPCCLGFFGWLMMRCSGLTPSAYEDSHLV